MSKRINGVLDLAQVTQAIKEKRNLVISAEEDFLTKLPAGSWIGGTSPYSMSSQGGACLPQQAFVQELPDFVKSTRNSFYCSESIASVYTDAPPNGFSILLVPAFSEVHTSFAVGAPNFPQFGTKPLIGWVTGTRLENLGKIPAKVFDGATLQSKADLALVMHVELPEDRYTDMGIVNIFEASSTSPEIEFLEDSFEIRDAMINGKKINFADYITANKIDIRWPIVGNYGGALVNLSFASVDNDAKTVKLLAPVFRGVSYKLSSPMGDYEAYLKAFREKIPDLRDGQVAFTCNCVLNYKYGDLDGQKIEELNGPFVFGEIAYQLLNQTLVYITVHQR